MVQKRSPDTYQALGHIATMKRKWTKTKTKGRTMAAGEKPLNVMTNGEAEAVEPQLTRLLQ